MTRQFLLGVMCGVVSACLVFGVVATKGAPAPLAGQATPGRTGWPVHTGRSRRWTWSGARSARPGSPACTMRSQYRPSAWNKHCAEFTLF